MPSHFCIRILPSKRPLDVTLLHVTTRLPSIHFGDESGLIRQASVEALTVKNADFNFGHVEPAGMFRRVVKDNTSQPK